LGVAGLVKYEGRSLLWVSDLVFVLDVIYLVLCLIWSVLDVSCICIGSGLAFDGSCV